jgi:spermidine synthase
LFSREFYALCDGALKPNGALATQNGVVFLQSEEARGTMHALRQLGLLAKCYQVAVPSYYGGSMVLGFGTRDKNVSDPSLAEITQRFAQMDGSLRHYTPAHHLASFALPHWIQAITGGMQ